MDFWDFDTSSYFREMKTMGKEPKRRHSRDMQNIVQRYYKDYFKKKLLIQIDEMAIQDFLVHLKIDRGLSASTVNLARNACFVALKYAKRRKHIQKFDFDAVLRASGNIKERGILEREEAEKIFTLPWRDPRSRLINLIASQTGMRLGEVRSLRICDIHEDKINVEHSWSKIDGGLKSTKNRERRQVPILPELYNELLAYIKKHHRSSSINCLMFSGEKAETPYDEKQIKKDFYAVLYAAGISEAERKERNIVFHSWRHYCAKNLAQVTNRTIGMAILGHKTSIMFDHYASHIDKETFNKMAQAIKEGLKPGGGQEPEIMFPKQANG
ncbi:tyrosine-type recombinase/integrase [Breznakiella homolactica]|uniref:Site-specific integrase n=1 Tax=Breznakiella homolactica TaxID=2798577 RepID=A0A7T7XLS4_9SPIR|nr:site-specific integrase [Breznakiella homolactica]QQO08650.1 tyrosine-type recombinase/integrase [Breznakiella homolactica]